MLFHGNSKAFVDGLKSCVEIENGLPPQGCLLRIQLRGSGTERRSMRKSILCWSCLTAAVLSSWLWQSASSQEPEERKPQKEESTGVATGSPHAPVKDAM